MVVSLVLEHQKPVFLHAVNVYLYLYRAGVDLLALVKVLEKPCLFELLCTDARKVHKRDRLVRPACIQVLSCVDIICERVRYIIRMNVYVVYYR